MTRLLFLIGVLAVFGPPALAQSDVHTVHVFATEDGFAYETRGEFGSNGPIVRANGHLVVTASDSLRIMVIVGEDDDGVAATEGPNTALPPAWHGTSVLKIRPYVDRGGPPTYHPVFVYVCTATPPPSAFWEGTPGAEDFYDTTPPSGLPCLSWQAVPPAAYSPTPAPLVLEINDGLGVYAPPPPPYIEDPPMGDPIDPED